MPPESSEQHDTPAHLTTLLYLPGLDGTGRLLHRQKALFENYRVLCERYPDAPQTYEDLACHAARRLEDEGDGRPAIVLTESFGGGVALTLALTNPDLIARMVLVNTFAYFPNRLKIRVGAWVGRFLPPRPSHPRTRRFRGRSFFHPDTPQEEQDAWWNLTSDVSMQGCGRRFAMIACLDLRPRLHEISIPTLVLSAPNDRLVAPSAGREIAQRLPLARLIEPEVAHAAMIHPSVSIHQLLLDPALWESES